MGCFFKAAHLLKALEDVCNLMKLIRSILIILAAISNLSVKSQAYFQQEVNYTIDVKLNDSTHELFANETIQYINHSPSTLSCIYMHLWPNAYKNNTTSLAKQLYSSGKTQLYDADEKDRGYIDQLNFKVNGESVTWELLKDSVDICKILLNIPLKSGDSITITTPFHVKLPSATISRLGHIGQAYMITQWYPKPAVFDKNGWNYMPYLNQGEFYSEFGSFDVSITLPKNYVLAATGDLIDGEKELEWLNGKAKETEAMVSFSNDMSFPSSAIETKTIRFKQNNVHDFAWFCDKRFHVLKGEMETPHTKRKVTTWAFFTNSQPLLWKKSISYINDALYYYSLWNGDYPYNNCTAVDGTIAAGSGMEYPTITIIGEANSDFRLDEVIAHEVGHNWFYGMLGTNERLHPWMDEGINSFNELRYLETKYPNRKLSDEITISKKLKFLNLNSYKYRSEPYFAYLLNAATRNDQPIELPAYSYTDYNYGTIVYAKTSLVLTYLMTYIGENKMNEAMQQYFERWKFKHPQPDDFRKVMEDITNKNLSWLFDELIHSTNYLDYKITGIHKNRDGSWDINVRNKGNIKSPVFIYGVKNKKLIGEVSYDGFSGKQTLTFPSSEIDYFKIDLNENMPEVNRKNNTIYTKGIFKTIEPLHLNFLASLPNPNRTQLFWTPAVGWNNYNRWMLGAAFYNALLPRKNFEFELLPLYSFGTKNIAGYTHASYTLYTNNSFIHHIQLGIIGGRFAKENTPFTQNFNKIAPEITIEFQKNNATSPFSHTLQYRNITLIQQYDKEKFEYNTVTHNRITENTNYNDFTYTISKKDMIHPFSVIANVQQGEQMAKAAFTFSYSLRFNGKKNKSLDIRFFAGTFLATAAQTAGRYRFRMSGQTGYQDYLYDHIYLGRSETTGILANQFTETDGGFKFFSYSGQSNKWLTAVNIKTALGKMKLPINLYADIGFTDKSAVAQQQLLFDAGVSLVVKKEVFEIFFPLFICKEFKNYKTVNSLNYLETIRFILNINSLNPFQLIRNIEL